MDPATRVELGRHGGVDRRLGDRGARRKDDEGGSKHDRSEGPHPPRFSQPARSLRNYTLESSWVRGEPEMGFEPMTYHLRGGCSTTELLRPTGQESQRAWSCPVRVLPSPRMHGAPPLAPRTRSAMMRPWLPREPTRLVRSTG